MPAPGLTEIATTTLRNRGKKMPIKGQSPNEVMHTEMHKFKQGKLHSGSKHGPEVKSRKQAIAIGLSESRQAKKSYDRSAHHPGNPGFPSSSEAGGSPPPATYKAHEAREREVMGAGYEQHEAAERNSMHNNPPHTFPKGTRSAHAFSAGHKQDGHLRNSGHSGAHRIGKRR